MAYYDQTFFDQMFAAIDSYSFIPKGDEAAPSSKIAE